MEPIAYRKSKSTLRQAVDKDTKNRVYKNNVLVQGMGGMQKCGKYVWIDNAASLEVRK